MNLLNLSTGTPSHYLTAAITKRGHTFDTYDPRELAINVSEQSGYDRVYYAANKVEIPLKLKASNYDAIISRIGADTLHSASILRHLNENLGIYCPQNAMGILIASDKLWSHQVFSQNRVKTINTYFLRQANHVKFFVEQLGGIPILVKTPTGSKGKGLAILDSVQSANSVLGLLHSQDVPVMLQRFVNTRRGTASATGRRLIVVGDKVVCAMSKANYDGDFRDNIAKGSEGSKYTPSEYEASLAVRATKALGLEFAGIDIISDNQAIDTNTFLVVEANSNPGTGIIAITGHNYFDDLIKHIETKAKQKVKVEKQEVNFLSHLPQGHPDQLRAENREKGLFFGR
jgi:ribosomal protein S6--L-glutamate ligase